MSSETDKSGKTTLYTYDAYGHLIAKSFDIYTVNYTLSGDISSVSIGTQTLVTYSYDGDGRLTTTAYANGQTSANTYDSNGNLQAVYFNSETTPRYSYNSNGDLSQKIDNVNSTRTVYDGDQVTVYSVSNGTETLKQSYKKTSDTFTETALGNTYTENHLDNQDQFVLSSTTSLNIYYTKDSDNKVTAKKITIKTGDVETTIQSTSYTYTNDNITAESHALNGSGESISYTYDDNGNITSAIRNGVKTAYHYDSNKQLVRVDDGVQNNCLYL